VPAAGLLTLKPESRCLESKKRKVRRSKHQLEADEIEEELQVQRAKKKDNELKTSRALVQKRLNAKMQQIMALQDRTKRPEVAKMRKRRRPSQGVQAGSVNVQRAVNQ
jgi:hypothetical protein